jgi:hypothetical protein
VPRGFVLIGYGGGPLMAKSPAARENLKPWLTPEFLRCRSRPCRVVCDARAAIGR